MHKLLIINLVFVFILSLANSAPKATKKPKCPKHWFKSNGCCYLVGQKKMTFLESQNFCNNKRKFNGTKTQLAPLYDALDYDELLHKENMKINLRKQINNSCGGKIPCKWWIRNVEDEEDEFVGPCVELVQIKPWKFRVHTNVDCFEKRRPLCARHLKKEDDLEE